MYAYRPDDVRTLVLLVHHEQLQHAEQAYMMYALRYLVMRNGIDYPAYSDYCESLKKKPVTDKRTADDIYNDIINQLKSKGGES